MLQRVDRATAAIDVVRSPRGDRAALLAGTIGDAAGAPVVDVDLGRVGFRVAGLSAAQGGAFSSAGDTLFLAGTSAERISRSSRSMPRMAGPWPRARSISRRARSDSIKRGRGSTLPA